MGRPTTIHGHQDRNPLPQGQGASPLVPDHAWLTGACAPSVPSFVPPGLDRRRGAPESDCGSAMADGPRQDESCVGPWPDSPRCLPPAWPLPVSVRPSATRSLPLPLSPAATFLRCSIVQPQKIWAAGPKTPQPALSGAVRFDRRDEADPVAPARGIPGGSETTKATRNARQPEVPVRVNAPPGRTGLPVTKAGLVRVT
jgi:hypothetical protein